MRALREEEALLCFCVFHLQPVAQQQGLPEAAPALPEGTACPALALGSHRSGQELLVLLHKTWILNGNSNSTP